MPLISESNLKKLIKNGESDTVEFKFKIWSDNLIAKTISALANTKGGIILFGIRDVKEGAPGEIVGLSPSESAEIVSRLTEMKRSFSKVGMYIAEQIVDGKLIAYAVIDPISDKESPVSTSTGEIFHRVHNRTLQTESKPKIKITSSSPKITAFVAMSFREEQEPALVDYFKAMERAIAELKIPIHLNRIDLKEGDFEISQEIMDDIANADIVICDFTLSPKNVYFELGFARGKGKRVIQTAKEGTNLEFDIHHWRTISYRNATELEAKLKPAIEKAYQDVISKNDKKKY